MGIIVTWVYIQQDHQLGGMLQTFPACLASHIQVCLKSEGTNGSRMMAAGAPGDGNAGGRSLGAFPIDSTLHLQRAREAFGRLHPATSSHACGCCASAGGLAHMPFSMHARI